MSHSPFPVPRIDQGNDGGRGVGAPGNRERGTLVIRAPNHLGDLVLALPALREAAADAIVVRRPLLPLLEMAGLTSTLIPLDRGARPLLATAAALRSEGFGRGILLTPSLSSAALFRLGGVVERRGTATDGRTLLLSDAVPAESLAGKHRAASYVALVTGELPAEPPIPRLEVAGPALDEWQALAGSNKGKIGIFPGSNASSRRWPAEQFGEVTRALAARGLDVVVFGGSNETALTAPAAAGVGRDFGGRTTLTTLAAGLADCALLITNDSGPMHLAAAVGTPTISLWGAGDPAETGPLGPGHRLLRHTGLPCVPCRMNACPRTGPGTILPQAERECLALISVAEVLAAVG